MSVKYACFNCRKILKVSGFNAVNEVGRIYCDGCGTNEDSLEVINESEFNIAIVKYIKKK